jgi:ribosome-associated protein
MAKTATLKAAEKRNETLAARAARECAEKRAENVIVLDLRKICDYTDFFVIATASSSPQMKGIIREIERVMAEEKCRVLSRNGITEGKWALLDCGDVMVHLFSAECREFYQLETLWGDARKIDWGSEFFKEQD